MTNYLMVETLVQKYRHSIHNTNLVQDQYYALLMFL